MIITKQCSSTPYNTESDNNNRNDDVEAKLINAILQDDKSSLISLSTSLLKNDDVDETSGSVISHNRAVTSKLLHLCCSLDSINCATSLLNGELTGEEADSLLSLVNELDDVSGFTPIHTASESHASRCVEMLLKKRARTDLRTRDGRGLFPLELSMYRTRMNTVWNPDESNVEELIVQLSEKDLTTVKLLSEKGKEIDDVAFRSGVQGGVVDLAILLIVAARRINELVLEVHDPDLNAKLKTTVYESVVKEALSLCPNAVNNKRKFTSETKDECDHKRKLLLSQIELLQLFGVVSLASCTDKKVASPLILASQAGDETIVELILRTNMDINDVDTDGNSALHWCLRMFKGSSPKHLKIMCLLLRNGAKVNQKNKLGLTAVHIAAGNGNVKALKILVLDDPDSINTKTAFAFSA